MRTLSSIVGVLIAYLLADRFGFVNAGLFVVGGVCILFAMYGDLKDER